MVVATKNANGKGPVLPQFLRVCGSVGQFARTNLFLLWLGAALLLWLINPINALPYPSEVLTAFRQLYNMPGTQNLVYNTYMTLRLNVLGLLYASIISAVIAYLSVVPLFQPLNKAVRWLRYIPVIGLNLLFLRLFAIGWSMKLAMIITGMSLFLVTSMTGVIASIPQTKYELARVLGYGDWQTFVSVILRPTLPQMIDAVAQNAAIGWLMIVGIETFSRTEGGIGSQIDIYCQTNQLAKAYAYLIVIGVIAATEDWLFSLGKRFLLPWSVIAEKA